MFQFQTLNAASNIGQRNIEAVEEVLDQLNIPIVAKHVGGSAGRTMVVDLQDFKTMVRQVKQEIVYL